MGLAASDVVPFTQARANLSELADQAKAGAEKIITKNGESYVTLIESSVPVVPVIFLTGAYSMRQTYPL